MWAAITNTIIALVTGALVIVSGVYLVVHETRRRERKVTRREIKDLSAEIDSLYGEQHALRMLLLEQRRYIYRLVTLMIDHGMDPPQPPAPSFDPGEYDNEEEDE